MSMKREKRKRSIPFFYKKEEIARVVREAFKMVAGRKGKVTSVDKANVLSSSRLWRETADEIAKEFPDVTLEHMLVDNAAMRLIYAPSQFDVIVTENMFGDILSDEASMLTGSLGIVAVSQFIKFRSSLV